MSIIIQGQRAALHRKLRLFLDEWCYPAGCHSLVTGQQGAKTEFDHSILLRTCGPRMAVNNVTVILQPVKDITLFE